MKLERFSAGYYTGVIAGLTWGYLIENDMFTIGYIAIWVVVNVAINITMRSFVKK